MRVALVNNAGVGGPIRVMWDGNPDAWWRAVEINLRGTFNCIHAVLPGMVNRGCGRVVNVASDAGAYRWPLVSHYSVAKAAVIKLTENLVGLAVEPERACDLVVRLASGETDELSGRYITVHDDLQDLVAHAENIRRGDSHVLRPR